MKIFKESLIKSRMAAHSALRGCRPDTVVALGAGWPARPRSRNRLLRSNVSRAARRYIRFPVI